MGNCLRLGISRIGLAWTKRRMKTTNKRNSISLLILGTQAVGKTTIALRLWKFKRALPDLNYVQTKGFNTYAIRRKNKSSINLYDLGGHPSIQELWDHYYADAHGVIFVVDVSNQTSLADAGIVFAKVVNDERIRGKPILLLANKQDLGGASDMELDSVMNLQEVVNAARCLTRLDESAATDLKNDKGIFDGFRWLVSHIENHYHELNDRVMHDILEEKNREKARRVAIKEQMDQSSFIPNNINHSPDRPSSQKSLLSRTFVRDESAIDLQQETTNDYDPNSGAGTPRPNFETLTTVAIQTTNYLIKSRPNSSLGESHNPFFLPRNVSTAPSEKRRSLPILHPTSGKPNMTFANRFFPNATNNVGDSQKISVDHFLVNGGANSTDRILPEQFPSAPISATGSGVSATAGRLSPEGADSDEGIINNAFDDRTETSQSELQRQRNVITTDAQDVKSMPCVATNNDTASISNQRQFASPNKFKKLIRTESTDTEISQTAAGEILMVTTLAQVHRDHLSSYERRGSTTSTHDSVALSLSSFKSEDAMSVMEGWREDDTSQSRSQSHTLHGGKTTPLNYTPHSHSGETNAAVFRANGNVPIQKDHSCAEKDKDQKSGLRVGIGKNKTTPLQSGLTIASTKPSSGPRRPRTTLPNSSSRNPVVALNSRKSRENVFNVTATTGGKNALKKKSLSGFGESPEINSASQLVRKSPSQITPPNGTRPRD